jgi:hypothetical protein
MRISLRTGIVLLMFTVTLFSVIAANDTEIYAALNTSFTYRSAHNISLGEKYTFNGTYAIENIIIYSLSSKANVTLPNTTVLPLQNTDINKRNITFRYVFEPYTTGLHMFNISFPGMNDTLFVSENFSVHEKLLENQENTLENVTLNQSVFSFILADQYFYDYGPVIINGSVSLFNVSSNSSLEGRIILSIMKENNSITNCTIPVRGTNGFFCELPNENIEITEYNMHGLLLVNSTNETFEFTDTFALELQNEDSLHVDAQFAPFVESGQIQNIILDIYDDTGFVDDADIGITITNPDKKEIEITPEIIEETYLANFIGLTPGIYTMSITVIHDTQYRSLERQFRITPKDVVLLLDVPEMITHNYGAVNVTGNITLLKENEFITKDVTLSIEHENGVVEECIVPCNGYCEFSCMLSRTIEFGNYTISASVDDDLITYTANDSFSLGFKEGSLFLDLQKEDAYYLEEVQDFFLQPRDTAGIRVNGSAFVLIQGPDDVEYRVVPERVLDGFMFSFVTLTPGMYSINISYIEESLFTSAVYTYEVYNISYENKPSRIWEYRKRKDIKKLLPIINDTRDERTIRLPTRLGEPLRWIHIGKEQENATRLNMTSLYGINITKDVSYFETAPVTFNETLTETSKRITFNNAPKLDTLIYNISLDNLAQVPKEYLLFKNNGIVKDNVRYIDANNDGLIDLVEWIGPLDLKTVIEVTIMDSHVIPQLEKVSHQRAILTSRFKNPDSSIATTSLQGCDVIVNNKTYPMLPLVENNEYLFAQKFMPGTYAYTMVCDQSVNEGSFTIEPLNKTIVSPHIDLVQEGNMTQLLSSQTPRYYQKNGTWHEIDTTFVPDLVGDELYYTSDTGLYASYLYNASLNHPFICEKDGVLTTFMLDALGTIENNTFIPLLTVQNTTRYYSKENSVFYENLFGNGTVLKITSLAGTLKSELILSAEIVALLKPQLSSSFVVRSRIKTPYIIDELTSFDPLYMRTESFEDTGIKIDQDFYTTQGQFALMERSVTKQGDEYVLLSTIPKTQFDQFSDELVIDPSFTIQATDRDAMSINNTIRTDYYSVTSPYLFIGKQGNEIYQAGVQFPVQIPSGATITNAELIFTAGENGTEGNFTPYISVENTTNAVAFSAGSGNISQRNYSATSVEWKTGNWTYLENYTSPDISSLVQYVIDLPGWSEGNTIGFMLEESSVINDYVSFHDTSSPGSYGAVLNITYLSVQSNPIIILSSPLNTTHTENTNMQFNFTPSDDEGLDTCELWTNATGTWSLNQTLSSVTNGTLNSFSAITLPTGYHAWNVWCNDTMGNAVFNESNATIYVGSPVMSLYSDA